MPPTAPANRERLAQLMNARRAELGLNWTDVSHIGGVAVKTLNSVRTGSQDIRDSTRRGIEDGLHWERGSIQAVLDGGDAVPLPGAPVRAQGPPAGAGSGWMPPVRPEIVAPLLAEADQIWAALREWTVMYALAHRATPPGDIPAPSGADLFGKDTPDARTWDDCYYLSLEARVRLLAGLRAERAAAGRGREHGTG